MDKKGIMGENGLGIRFVGDWGKWDMGAVQAVECEIEVLYEILACGVLEKMKIHPRQAMPAKVQKAGFNILPHSVQYRPARPYTSPGVCLLVHIVQLYCTYTIHSVIVRFIVLLFCVWCGILYGI